MKRGITRIVLLLGNYAFKFPSFEYGHVNFLQGCLANWKERKYYKDFKGANYEGNMVKYVAPSHFCLMFGLMQIQARCESLKAELTEEQKRFYKPLCGTDTKKENFGILDSRIVCLDYP